MSDRLYVYITHWERFQPRSDRPGLPWLRLYTDLLGNDDYLELSTPDRCLLHGLWMSTQVLGQGRVSSNLKSLRLRYNAPRSSLERLVEAGFITLSTTKGAPNGHQTGGLEEKREKTTSSLRREENARESATKNGAPRRSEKDMQKRLEEAISLGYQPEGLA